MAINRWMVKETVVHPYSVIQAGHKKKGTITTHDTMDESQSNDTEFL